MDANRIAITGLGCVSAIGSTAEETWTSMADGVCGLGPFRDIETHDLVINLGGEVKGEVAAHIDPRERRLYDRFTLMALDSANQAIAQSGLTFDDELALRTACIIGVGIAGFEIIEEGYRTILSGTARRPKVYTVPRIMPGAPASQVSMQFGLKGPVYGVTSACSSANHAIASGYQTIKSGLADVAIVGGTDAPLIWGILKGWEVLRILAPEACRPFSANRNGLVLADGAGVAVLERMDHARARGAPILAELAGVGMSADASDIFLPTVEGPARAMELCLASSNLAPGDIDYVNAHGTGTQINDATETKILRQVFGKHADNLAISSTKSMHGHAIGGSAGIELIACVKAIETGIIPPTINLTETDPECDLDYTPLTAGRGTVRAAISNSFAFGGTNGVIAVTAP